MEEDIDRTARYLSRKLNPEEAKKASEAATESFEKEFLRLKLKELAIPTGETSQKIDSEGQIKIRNKIHTWRSLDKTIGDMRIVIFTSNGPIPAEALREFLNLCDYKEHILESLNEFNRVMEEIIMFDYGYTRDEYNPTRIDSLIKARDMYRKNPRKFIKESLE